MAEARKRADEARAPVRSGRDPLDVKAAERQAAQVARAQADAKQRAVTFKQVALDYIRAHDPGWKSRKHSSQWLSTLEAYAFPHIGEMAPAEITTNDALAVLKPIWTKRPETASRVRSRCELACGQRRHEDYARARTLSRGATTSVRCCQHAPRSRRCVIILRSTGDRCHGGALSDMSMTMPLRRSGRCDAQGDAITLHGFRSSFRDWCAEATQHPSDVAEAALAHVVGSKVQAAYQRGTMYEKRRVLMGEWTSYYCTLA